MEGADELAIAARVAAKAVAVVGFPDRGGELAEPVAGCRDFRAAEEGRRLVRPVQDGRHVAEFVAGHERMVRLGSRLRSPIKSGIRLVDVECEVGLLHRHDVGLVFRLAGSRCGDKRLERVVRPRVDVRGGAGGAPFAVAREREAGLRPRTEVSPADRVEAGRRATVGEAVAGLVEVADPDIVVRAGRAEVLPGRGRVGVRLAQTGVADAVEIPDGARGIVACVVGLVGLIVPVLDAGQGRAWHGKRDEDDGDE